MPSQVTVGQAITDQIIPGVMKPSIIFFDCNPGTRNVTLQPGRYRIAAVGAGGGGGNNTTPCNYGANGGAYSEKVIEITTATLYSYTVGAPGIGNGTTGNTGGASSFGALITANGGTAPGGSAATATGGDINYSGGVTTVTGNYGGASSANRFGPGVSGFQYAGAGWAYRDTTNGSGAGAYYLGGQNYVDGFGIGLPPGVPAPIPWVVSTGSSLVYTPVPSSGYGCGGTYGYTNGSNSPPSSDGGMGGGGASHGSSSSVSKGGIGGGGATGTSTVGSPGGPGLILVEKLA